MIDLSTALQNGANNLWVFVPTAILLGAMHGLEPGHSKTMMASFIIAIRGTIRQAILLGVSAAISHTLVIWILAAIVLSFGSQWNVERVEPYIELISSVLIAGMAVWMFLRTRRDIKASKEHTHGHSELFMLDTVLGKAELSVFEVGVPPVFRIKPLSGSDSIDSVTVETIRSDGETQLFQFSNKGEFWESQQEIPEPHEFDAFVHMQKGAQHSKSEVPFREAEHHHHHGEGDFQDAHEKAHALDIVKRFDGQSVTTPQIILLGLPAIVWVKPSGSPSLSYATFWRFGIQATHGGLHTTGATAGAELASQRLVVLLP